MDLLAALLLGLVQGITEWIPVSSSGHLVLIQAGLNISAAESVLFDLALHVATLVSVTAFLRRDLQRIIRSMIRKKETLDDEHLRARKLGWMALLATIPAVFAGIFLSGYVETIFTPGATAVALLFTGLMLWLAEIPSFQRGREEIGVREALIIGCFQALSIIPGISRSGSTISAGCYLGMRRELVAIFSFLMSIPIIIAAVAYGAALGDGFEFDLTNTLLASIVAAVSGFLALRLLFDMIKRYRLRLFAIYCWGLGILALVVMTLST